MEVLRIMVSWFLPFRSWYSIWWNRIRGMSRWASNSLRMYAYNCPRTG